MPPQPAAPEVESARQAYATRVRQRYGRLDLEVLTPLREQDEHPVLQLRDVFVPQSVRADPPPVELPQELLRRLMDPAEAELHDLPPGIDRETVDRVRRAYQERPPLPVLDVLTAPEHDRVVLLGHPGSGKSTLARYLALTLTSPEPPAGLQALHGSLPLIVELREYAQPAWRERTFEDFLAHQHATEGLGLPPETLAALLAGEGPYTALVVFDGLDELFEKDVRDAVARRIAGFAARHSRARIVVTSRGYGYQRAVLDGAGFTNFMLQDLDREQIGAFAEQWFSLACPDDPTRARKLIERVTTAVDASTSVRELAGNPLILTILAIIGRRRELPRDRRTVYEHAVDVLVEHWDPSKYLKDRQVEEHLPYLGPEDKRELLRLIARQMQEGHGGISGNHIAGPDLLKSFEEYLKDRYALPPDRAAPAARVMLDQFRHRNFILSRYGGEIYGFVHRTFLEYLAATDLAHRFNQERSLSEQDLQDLFADKVHDPTWHEILLLLVGLLDERFVAGVIDRLLGPRTIAVPLGNEEDQAFAAVVFVARCLGEARRIGVLAPQSRAMMRQIVRLFRLAGLLEVTSFSPPCDIVESLFPAIAALGENWEGGDDYLSWWERWRRAEGHGDEVPPSGSVRQFAADLAMLLRGRRSTGDAVRTVEEALIGDDAAARIGAFRMLLRRPGRDPGLLEVFERCVREERDPAVRALFLREAAYSSDIDPHWIPRIAAERLAHDTVPEVRLAAIDGLSDREIDIADTYAALDIALNDPVQLVRLGGTCWLIAYGEDRARAMSLLREGLRDKEPEVRATVLVGVDMGTDDGPAVRALVRERLRDDESAAVVAAAIRAARSIGDDDPETLALLRTLHDHDSPMVRRAVLRYLAEIRTGDEDLTGLLFQYVLHDEEQEIRVAALASLKRFDRNTTALCDELLDRAVRASDLQAQDEALAMLVELAPDRARDLVIDRAGNHADENIRAGSLFSLIADYRNDAEAMRVVLDRAAEDSMGIRLSILQDFIQHGVEGPECLDLAQDRFDHDPDPIVRLAALGILVDLRRDDPEFLFLLRRAIKDEAPKIRDLATAALAVLAPQDA
ncbi:HEAT repeat domain-containing protein [Streptomyces sp. NPDC098101]|uniref:HEAT repeat domain-containing protein n=1 Tax=Streptomyces sp. NPDC098101 TaxID=3366096 RepID=UPI0038101A36